MAKAVLDSTAQVARNSSLEVKCLIAVTALPICISKTPYCLMHLSIIPMHADWYKASL